MTKYKLNTLREGWDSLYDEETHLLRAMTIIESLNMWARLQNAFERQLQQSSRLFEPERRKDLIELQARLKNLVG